MPSYSNLLLSCFFLVLIGNYILTYREGMDSCNASPEANTASISIINDELKAIEQEVDGLNKLVTKNTNEIKSMGEQLKGFQKAALYKAKYSSN